MKATDGNLAIRPELVKRLGAKKLRAALLVNFSILPPYIRYPPSEQERDREEVYI